MANAEEEHSGELPKGGALGESQSPLSTARVDERPEAGVTSIHQVDAPEEELAAADKVEKSRDIEKFVAPFPTSRVKRIAKLDKDVRLLTSDAVALVAEATALFVQSLGSALFTVLLQT